MADKGLSLGLKTEFAAIYAYAVAGGHLTGAERKVAQANESVHRDRRDDVMVRLTESGATLPGEEAAYTLPVEVGDAASAAELISEMEERATRQWRAVLADTSGADREAAVSAYSSSAVTLARWKRALGESPSTTAFPGRT